MVDYSKWDGIEVSEDEDDTQLHQDCLEYVNELMKREKEQLEKKPNQEEAVGAAWEMFKGANHTNMNMKHNIIQAVAAVEKELKSAQKDKESLKHEEKVMLPNVDTRSKEVSTKKLINKPSPLQEDKLTDKKGKQLMQKFVEENEKLLRQYGMLRKYEDSKQFLTEHDHLVCDDTVCYLVDWCISLAVENKHELMTHVAHQFVCMQILLDVSKKLQVDPRIFSSLFFTVIQECDKEHRILIEEEISNAIGPILYHAKGKIDKEMQEAGEERKACRRLDALERRIGLEIQDISRQQMLVSNMPTAKERYNAQCIIESLLILNWARKTAKGTREAVRQRRKPVRGAWKAAIQQSNAAKGKK